ncbi:MAG: hypothetical protein MUF31_07615 [Akkermansiaceae bacterium]|jgi:hypothetical protein|nr:hypothetical protein [Akkermansiaceae bacterium]
MLVAQETPARLDGDTPAERAAAMVRWVATIRPAAKDEQNPKASAPCYAARLVLGIDLPYALAKLDAAASHRLAMGRDRIEQWKKYEAAKDKTGLRRPGPALDPFDKVALINTYFLGKSRIPAATAAKIRDYVALYDDHKELQGYARGAWNYKLMLDASGFLAAEEWPDLVDRSGLDASQIKEATRARLFAGFSEITGKNFSEYGATIYNGVNLSAIRMLVEFARDPEMRKRATMTLDAMLLDIACTWNQGYNIGSASRAKYWYSSDTGLESMASTAAAAWIHFGAVRSINTSGLGWNHGFWMAPPGRYKAPDLVIMVARERSRPFLTRSHIAAMGRANVHRMTWHTPTYSLASQWDQPGDPTSGLYKESRRHMLKWISDKPSSTFIVGMENPHRPYNLGEKRANALGYGENGFSQYMQHRGTLLGLYAVPEQVKVRHHVFDYPYFKMYAPFPVTGSIRKRIERDGWVFCHNGSMLMGFHCIQPWKWGKRWGQHDMLWCEARRNGWILETAPLASYAGGGVDAELDRFARAVLEKTRIKTDGIDSPSPTLAYRNLEGDVLEFRWQAHAEAYADHMKVNGKPIVFDSSQLHRNPWVAQKVGGPLHIRLGPRRLVLDFETWTKTETP